MPICVNHILQGVGPSTGAWFTSPLRELTHPPWIHHLSTVPQWTLFPLHSRMFTGLIVCKAHAGPCDYVELVSAASSQIQGAVPHSVPPWSRALTIYPLHSSHIFKVTQERRLIPMFVLDVSAFLSSSTRAPLPSTQPCPPSQLPVAFDALWVIPRAKPFLTYAGVKSVLIIPIWFC